MTKKTYPYKSGKFDIFGDEIWVFEEGAENEPPYSITFDSREEYEKWAQKNLTNYNKNTMKNAGKSPTEKYSGHDVKKSKYEVGDKVYSWQNKDYAAPITRKQFEAWEHPSQPHENDAWKYFVRLKDGTRSKLMNEDSLYSTKQDEYKEGGKPSNAYKTIVDPDGTKWEAIPSKKGVNRNFDIYMNGEKMEYGAHLPTDIEPAIDQMRDTENR